MSTGGKVFLNGTIAGLAGGLAFSIVLCMGDMFPMLAKMVGSKSVMAGLLVHAGISIITGIIFAMIFDRLVTGLTPGAIYGMIYGAIWWFLGPLTLMPLMSGKSVRWTMQAVLDTTPSLMGHIFLLGLVLGLVYAAMKKCCRDYC